MCTYYVLYVYCVYYILIVSIVFYRSVRSISIIKNKMIIILFLIKKNICIQNVLADGTGIFI